VRAGGFTYLLEETIRLHGGKWLYIKYPDHIQKVEEAKLAEAERELSDYKTPEEWLEGKEDTLCALLKAFFSPQYCSTTTKNRMRYTIDPAHAAAIQNEIEAALQRIRDLPVKAVALTSNTAKPADRQKASKAAVDGGFQSFMRGVLATPAIVPRGKRA
jgi:hypothetical protein